MNDKGKFSSSRFPDASGPTRYRFQPRLLRLLLALMLLTAIRAPAHAASEPVKPSIMVMPFDLFDDSADQRPAIVDAQNRWLRELPGQVNQALREGGRFRVIDNTVVGAGLHKLAGNYAHPTLCGLCMLKLGEKAGAGYVVVGQLRKVSNLIIYLQAEIDDVRTRQVVDQVQLEVKADNAAMLRLAAHRLARKVEHSIAGISKNKAR